MTELQTPSPTTPAAEAAADTAPLLRTEGLKVHFPITEGIVFERRVG